MARLTRSELARLRRAAGFPSAALAAEALGCSRIYVLEIEEGRSRASEGILERMARAYSVPVHTLRRAAVTVRKDLLQRELQRLKSS